jgi:hypothetical protein
MLVELVKAIKEGLGRALTAKLEEFGKERALGT